jgi:uncharacterized membrane protein YfcA
MLELGAITLLSSFTNGILGAGGAILFLPLALYVLPPLGTKLEPHLITALSLTQGVCAFAAGGVAYARRGQVSFRQLWLSGPAIGVGAMAGGVVSAAAPGWLLVLLFAIVATTAAILLLIPPTETKPRGHRAQVLATAIFVGIGGIGGAVGVGAGVLVIPVLLYVLGMPHRLATGTGLTLPILISGPALIGKALSGQVVWSFIPVVAVTAVVGVTLGSRAHLAIPSTTLRYGLSGLTGVLALTVWIRLAVSV